MGFFSDDELQENNEDTATVEDLDKEAKAEVATLETEPTTPEVTPQTNNSDDNIPTKYRGKSIEDVIRMHQSAEDLIRKHSDEVGFARRMAEQLAARQEADKGSQKRTDADPNDSNVDFFADPVNAVKKAVETHPDVVAARESTLENRKQRSLEMVVKAVGDPAKYFADPEFIEWVQAKPFRGQALRHADVAMDADAAIEIFENYNMHKSVKENQRTTQQNEVTSKNQAAKKAAIVDGGSSGEKSTGTIYKRSDLIRLQNTDPDRYERLMPQIIKAYAEGRVR